MLAIKQLNHSYGQSRALWDLDFSVPEGTITCVMGRNGVGKTTLVKCILGLEPINSGEITLSGEVIHHLNTENRVRRGIGYVPQGREIFSSLTVEENLIIALGARRDKLKKIPERVYELFPVLKEMGSRRGGDLSGGQQQQLAVGRALVSEPDLLILDEPNEGIQPNIVQQIGEVLLQLNKDEKLTIILVEQKLTFARRLGQLFYLMDKGRCVAEGDMTSLGDELIEKYLAV
ncbi:MAG: urea ABC transporter ATP-binding subunit UrtE [Pseudomonadales bacterium]|nr:urea ABC transporter ATP-binding subunit UrtE [Pseudomonadales bacterium]